MTQGRTIEPTDYNTKISGKLTHSFPPDENNPTQTFPSDEDRVRCSLVLVDIEWDLTGARQIDTAIIKFQCRPRDQSTGNELQFKEFDSLLNKRVELEYIGNHRIRGDRVEIEAMSVSLIS